MFVPVVTTIREVGAADAAVNGPGSIVIEIAGAMVRAQRGVDLGWLRDVLLSIVLLHRQSIDHADHAIRWDRSRHRDRPRARESDYSGQLTWRGISPITSPEV